MPYRILLSLLLLATTQAAQADSHDWIATSTTAMAITGDILVEDGRIVFQNGAALELEALGPDRPGLYRVSPSQNPVLLNGNRLCGDKPPAFVALAHSETSDSLAKSQNLYLKVFDGAKPPPAAVAKGMDTDSPGLCALLNYERAKAS